jgi:hypothetical protein
MRSSTSLDYRTVYECSSCREQLVVDYGVESNMAERRTSADRRIAAVAQVG